MPRAFSERERELIRQKLRAAGRDAFAAYGLKRTAVDDLVRAAGISKGAYYLFYDSKEALLQELLEHAESEFQNSVLQRVLTPELSARQSLHELLRLTILERHNHPLLSRVGSEEMDLLARRIPVERAEALRRADVSAVARWMYYWRARGTVFVLEAEVLTGMLRALVFASLHEAEIGRNVYSRVLEALVDGIAAAALAEGREEEADVSGPGRFAPPARRPRSLESRLQGGPL
jgi:AcrR family transcriptional regulator